MLSELYINFGFGVDLTLSHAFTFGKLYSYADGACVFSENGSKDIPDYVL